MIMDGASAASSDEFPAVAGNLYAQWTLDCLVDISYAISQDAISRPELYQSDDIPDEIVTLRMSYGTAPHLPNTPQRQAMMMPILGPSDGLWTGQMMPARSTSSFQIARRKFVDACAAFAQQASDIEGPILEDRVRSAAATLRGHFHGMRGKTFGLSVHQMKASFDIAIRILKSPGISKVFGVGHIDPGWPLHSTDPNGAKLVEFVGTALSGVQKVTFTDFLLLQRIAEEGAQSIQVLLSADHHLSDQELKSVINRGYIWGADLREVWPVATQYAPPSAAVAQPQAMAQRAMAGGLMGAAPMAGAPMGAAPTG